MAITLSSIVVAALLLCFVTLASPTDITPKEYIVNLDLSPEDRWIPVLKDYKQIVNDWVKALKTYFPGEILELVEKIAGAIDDLFPSPFPRELKGIAKYLNVSLGEVVLPNILYDVTAFCTSIVAQDTKGNIWHGRNLDYKFTDMLKNSTIVLHFQRSGKTLYSAPTFAGYIGLMTGQKPNVFTVSVDERHEGDWWMNLLVALLERKVSLVSFLVRQTLESASSFSEAVYMLSHPVTMAPAYFIVGGRGPAEGAVITKRRFGERDIWFLKPDIGRWYLVETNFDHWKKPGDNRRAAAMKAMNATGQSAINPNTMYKVLSTSPVLNSKTIYTTVMSAAHPCRDLSYLDQALMTDQWQRIHPHPPTTTLL